MKRHVWHCAAGLCVIAALLAPRIARGAPPVAGTLVLLPIEGDQGGLPRLREELVAALGSIGQPVQLARLRLDELLLAVGCAGRSVYCLQQIGKVVRAQSLLLGSASRQGERVTLELRWVDMATGADAGRKQLPLHTDPVARRAQLEGLMRALFGAVSVKGEVTGHLAIRSSLGEIEVSVDGQSRGVLPLELHNLAAGRYRIDLRRAGYHAQQRLVQVVGGRTTELQIELVPAPGSGPRPRFVDSLRVPTWVVAGAALTCFAVGLGFAAHMLSEQNAFDGIAGRTLDEVRQLERHKRTGERDQIVANVLFGVGGAALVAAAVMAYIDYRRATVAPGERAALAKRRWHLGVSSVGVSF